MAACVSAPPKTDFVTIEPLKYVPPPQQPVRDGRFGWLPTTAAEADAFRVRVGNRQYSELLDRAGPEGVAAELARFAEREVLSQNLCASGAARTMQPQIVGPRDGTNVWVLVECIAKV
jgi:hypothetical protein